MIPRFRLFSLLLTLVMAIGVRAQLPTVDITLVDNGNNELEVRVRPDADFDGLFSSLVFTIRWDASSNANLGAIQQMMPAQAYMPIQLSGAFSDASGYRYQVFSGVSLTALSSLGVSWDAGVEYPLMTIPVVNGSSVFEIVNDGWTAANNGDYYVSCNGSDRTGVIYTISTGITMGDPGLASLSVQPNPASGSTLVLFELSTPGDAVLDVMNSAGQIVWRKEFPGATGTVREELDLRGLPPGNYPLRLHAGERTTTTRLVVR